MHTGAAYTFMRQSRKINPNVARTLTRIGSTPLEGNAINPNTHVRDVGNGGERTHRNKQQARNAKLRKEQYDIYDIIKTKQKLQMAEGKSISQKIIKNTKNARHLA